MFDKVKLALLGGIFALAACGQDFVPASEKPVLNGSGAEMEAASSKGLASLAFRSKSATISVPAATAQSRLGEFATQCIDQRTVVIESFGGGAFGAGYSVTNWHMRANIAEENGIVRLLILGDADTNNIVIGDKDGFNVLTTTQILPSAEGTTLNTRHVIFWGRLHDAAVQWAAGNATVCPDLTKLFKPI